MDLPCLLCQNVADIRGKKRGGEAGSACLRTKADNRHRSHLHWARQSYFWRGAPTSSRSARPQSRKFMRPTGPKQTAYRGVMSLPAEMVARCWSISKTRVIGLKYGSILAPHRLSLARPPRDCSMWARRPQPYSRTANYGCRWRADPKRSADAGLRDIPRGGKGAGSSIERGEPEATPLNQYFDIARN